VWGEAYNSWAVIVVNGTRIPNFLSHHFNAMEIDQLLPDQDIILLKLQLFKIIIQAVADKTKSMSNESLDMSFFTSRLRKAFMT
jgi:hypothetical protein